VRRFLVLAISFIALALPAFVYGGGASDNSGGGDFQQTIRRPMYPAAGGSFQLTDIAGLKLWFKADTHRTSRITKIVQSIIAPSLCVWLLGLLGGVGGGLIHLLLVVALIVLIFNLLSGRREL
jgi:hypothetical protein